jgi:cobyrinic acid a,c-diamide synthase
MSSDSLYRRVVVAGLGGDSGKTLVSLGMLLLARDRGLPVAAFKKGPDYIDAAWLAWASGLPARNLDTYLMGFDAVKTSFARSATAAGLSVIEGNRGLYDGFDAQGTHSTAALAKTLGAPVVLVFNATKVTRTAAALVLGCQRMDPDVRIAGVVLNQVAGRRHESVIREAIESTCGIPVLGTLPRAAADTLLPGRHLGLVTPEEHQRIADLEGNIRRLCEPNLDFDGILAAAADCPAVRPTAAMARGESGAGLTIGYVKDSAFTFYYPENLESLERAGACLEPLSPLGDGRFPENLDVLYIGGGFPETHGPALSASDEWLGALRAAAEAGLPIYAECGGLMLLSRGILRDGRRYPMSGVLPFDVEVLPHPQGHGYIELEVDRPNPFFPEGTRLKGHEFHYSRIVREGEPAETACRVTRGTGCYPGRDGIFRGAVWAAYTHLHALGTPEWTKAILSAPGHFTHYSKGPPGGI